MERTQFCEEEILALLRIYKDPEYESMKRRFKSHVKVWEDISKKLYEAGLDDKGIHQWPQRGRTQVLNKFNNLKSLYTKTKKRLESGSGGDGKKYFNYFTEFEDMFGTKSSSESFLPLSSIPKSDIPQAGTSRAGGFRTLTKDQELIPTQLSSVPQSEVGGASKPAELSASCKSKSQDSIPSFQPESEPLEKRKYDDAFIDIQNRILDVVSKNFAISEQRFAAEETLMENMSYFFVNAGKYYEKKIKLYERL